MPRTTKKPLPPPAKTLPRSRTDAIVGPNVGLRRYPVSRRQDGWVNGATGAGTLRDKGTYAVFVSAPVLTPAQDWDLFNGSDLANTIASALPEDAFREGFEAKKAVVTGPTTPDTEVQDAQDQAAELSDELDRLGVEGLLEKALTFGRVAGGAALVLLVNGAGKPAEPLDDSKAKGLAGILLAEREDLTPQTWVTDALDPRFGQVETWTFQRVSTGAATSPVTVHASRLVMLGGVLTSPRAKRENLGWDHSVYDRINETLRKAEGNWDSVNSMIVDMSQSVFKMKDLLDTLSEDDGQGKIAQRLADMDMGRSVYKAVCLDSEHEDFDIIERSAMTGMDALLTSSWQRLAAAAHMPLTRLFGMSPSGMNATGESDVRGWYDQVRAYQRKQAQPALLRVVRLVAQGLFGDSTGWSICWKSLWQETPTERATRRQAVATTDKLYIDAGVVTAEEVTLSRWGSGEYSDETTVDLDSRRSALESELEKIAANEPDPVPPPFGQPAAQDPAADPTNPAPAAQDPAADVPEAK